MLFGLPPALLALGLMFAQVGEPHPGVSVFTRLAGWAVPGDSVTDPEARAILEVARASEELGGRPVWMRQTNDGLMLMTIRAPGIQAAAQEALAGTSADTSHITFYRSTDGLVLMDAIGSFQEDPDAVVSSVRLYVPLVLGASGFGFLVAGWWFRRRRPVDGWDRPAPDRPSLVRQIGIGIGVGFLVMLASLLAGLATLLLFDLERVEQPIITSLSESSGFVLVSFVVLGVVIAPIGEELFFRGHLFRWSASRCGSTYAYVLTAAIFALLHANPSGILNYVVLSVTLAWAYERWRILFVPIVAHATINALAITLLILR